MADGNEGFFAMAGSVIAAAASHVMRDGSIEAVGREAVKDVRNSIHEVFFGQSERFGEPGAPMNITQSEVAELRRADDFTADMGQGNALPSPSEVAAQTSLYQPPPDQGNGQDLGNGR